MRTRRIKLAAEEGEAVYHCVSKTVNGEHLFSAVDQEAFRKQLWVVADFCGVQVLTWTILSNHFHVLVRIPQTSPVSDEELLRRYQVLHPKPTKYQTLRLDVIRGYLAANSPESELWRGRQLAQMGDVSAFMKLLKQRFSIWFNKHHSRFGTLWSERFKSVLVEAKHRVTESMAAYIDLNCVRANLSEDPKDYRFCGYAEAVGGSLLAQKGIISVVGGTNWETTQASYRQILFTTGAGPRSDAKVIDEEAMKTVLASKGKLSLNTVLLCRLKYLTCGAVLGGREFVDAQLAKYQRATGRRKQSRSLLLLPHSSGIGEVFALRRCRA